MKYKILNKAIRVDSYTIDNDKFIIYLSLLNYKIEILKNYKIILNKKSNNLYSNIRESIFLFKNTDDYKNAEYSIDNNKIFDSENYLSREYDSINDLSNLKYFDSYSYNLSDYDYTKTYITRYIAKFLNHNILTDISVSDYNDIINKNENTHFEAYDVTYIPWRLTGTKNQVFEENSQQLDKLNTIFGMNKFYGLYGSDNGPFYLTIYDEIPNLYTTGGELIYEDVLKNYGGYYHYIRGRLWSGKSNTITDESQIKRTLIEGAIESDFDLNDQVGDDIISDIKNVLNTINDEIKKYPNALYELESEINGLVSDFTLDLKKSMDEFLDGTDLKDIFNESFQDALDIQKNPNLQESIEKKYNDRNKKHFEKAGIGNKLKNKGPKMPKIKIPNPHIGRPPHGEGTDHNYELGF